MERKLVQTDGLSLKFDGEGSFEGYASVFGGVDSYGDTIIKGAYEETLQGRSRPVRMRWNHFGPIIGKWMAIGEDEKGLKVKGSLTPGHSVAKDAYASLQHGAIDGMSIGYMAREVREMGDGRRELHKIDLIEISLVEEPADLGARITGLKSAINELESLKEVEGWMRDAFGLSKDDATALVGRIKAVTRRDGVGDKIPSIKENDLSAIALAMQLHAHKIARK